MSWRLVQGACALVLGAFASISVAENLGQENTYIIGFSEAPLATYRGEICNLPAPPRRGEGRGRVDVASRAAKAYVGHLKQKEIREPGVEQGFFG
jgi:hypothetical protein